MAKMGDLYINIKSKAIADEEWQKIGEGKVVFGFDAANGEDATALAKAEPTADLSQIEADLAKLPKVQPLIQPYQQKYLAQMPSVNELSFNATKKWVAEMYGVSGNLIEHPSSEVVALRKAIDVLEKKLAEMQYGQSQTIVVPIYKPPTNIAYDSGLAPKPTIKRLTVTIRLEE